MLCSVIDISCEVYEGRTLKTRIKLGGKGQDLGWRYHQVLLWDQSCILRSTNSGAEVIMEATRFVWYEYFTRDVLSRRRRGIPWHPRWKHHLEDESRSWTVGSQEDGDWERARTAISALNSGDYCLKTPAMGESICIWPDGCNQQKATIEFVEDTPSEGRDNGKTEKEWVLAVVLQIKMFRERIHGDLTKENDLHQQHYEQNMRRAIRDKPHLRELIQAFGYVGILMNKGVEPTA